MNGDLGKQSNPPVVDHSWLAVDLGEYDNYPSDNQPLRILPKLSEIWNPPQAKEQSMNLIPNRIVAPCSPMAASDAPDVVREAKKAMMSGNSGHKLADHLKARFTPKQIESAKEELVKLASEQGLLGNVYIDASAFESYSDAERFLTRHRSRLARDIVTGGQMSAEILGTLASGFRKNVVAAVSYDADLFKTYKDHLVALGKISRDTVIDSKESLRLAFLADPKTNDPALTAKPVAPAAPAEEAKAFASCASATQLKNRLAEEEIDFRALKPIVVFAREQMSRGKTGSELKGILRDKYTVEQLKAASKYLAVISSDETVASVGKIVAENKMSETVGNSLIKLAGELPIRKSEYVTTEPKRSGLSHGFFHAVVGTTKSTDKVVLGAVQALRIGHDMTKVRKALLSRMSFNAADKVMIEAVRLFNAAPTGVKANKVVKAAKVMIDVPEAKPTSLNKTASAKQSQDVVDFFADPAEMIVDTGTVHKHASLDIQGQFNRSGMDSALNG